MSNFLIFSLPLLVRLEGLKPYVVENSRKRYKRVFTLSYPVYRNGNFHNLIRLPGEAYGFANLSPSIKQKPAVRGLVIVPKFIGDNLTIAQLNSNFNLFKFSTTSSSLNQRILYRHSPILSFALATSINLVSLL